MLINATPDIDLHDPLHLSKVSIVHCDKKLPLTPCTDNRNHILYSSGGRSPNYQPICEEPGCPNAERSDHPVTTFNVTDCSNDSQLQDFINHATDGDTITFACSV